jgi:hypothetical protein
MNRREISYSEIDVFLYKARELLVPHWSDWRDAAFVGYLNKTKTSGPEFNWHVRFIQVGNPPTYKEARWWFTDEEYELARELLSPYAKVLIKMRQAG